MKNITNRFRQRHYPVKSLVLYQADNAARDCFVESYDFSDEGKMINAHPLTLKESHSLGRLLSSSLEKNNNCFEPSGLLPGNVLYVSAKGEGCVVWVTPPGRHRLLFKEALDIPSGEYALPALLWKANKESLQIFGLKSARRPTAKTTLFKAPFFNMYDNGGICLGTIDVSIDEDAHLEQFINQWEAYFFNSYFSHLIAEVSPVKGNIVQLYQNLKETGITFPTDELLPFNKTIQQLIHEN